MFFISRPALCTLIASVCLTACFCAFFSLLAVTLNRYVCVCHNSLYSRIFSRKKNVGMCLVIWVSAFLCEMPNYMWDDGHIFDLKNHSCIWNRSSVYIYTILISTVFIWAPLVAMTGIYVKIFMSVMSSKAKIHNFGNNGGESSSAQNMKVWRASIRSSKTLFIVLVSFLLFWSPYALVIILDHGDTMSIGLHLYVTLCAHLHSSANGVIYLVTNSHFRTSMLEFLGCRPQSESSSENIDGNQAQQANNTRDTKF